LVKVDDMAHKEYLERVNPEPHKLTYPIKL